MLFRSFEVFDLIVASDETPSCGLSARTTKAICRKWLSLNILCVILASVRFGTLAFETMLWRNRVAKLLTLTP